MENSGGNAEQTSVKDKRISLVPAGDTKPRECFRVFGFLRPPSATRQSLKSGKGCFFEIHGFASLLRNRFAFIVCNRQLSKDRWSVVRRGVSDRQMHINMVGNSLSTKSISESVGEL